MTQRQYINLTHTELAALAQQHWASVDVLKRVLEEVALRRSRAAGKLRQSLLERIAQLSGAPAGGSSSQASASGGQSDLHGRPSDVDERVSELQGRAERAEKRINELSRQLEEARARASANGAHRSEREDLFAQVGLVPECPDFVIDAVKRAFRKQFHPDALSDRPRSEQAAAQEQFKSYEVIFDDIAKL